jgi:hypothetical protein
MHTRTTAPSSNLTFLPAFSAPASLRQPLVLLKVPLRQLSTSKRMTGDSKQLTHSTNPQLAAEPMRLTPDRGRLCSRRPAAYLQTSAIFSTSQNCTHRTDSLGITGLSMLTEATELCCYDATTSGR